MNYFDIPTFWEEQKLRETFIQAYRAYVENYRRNLSRDMISGRKVKAELPERKKEVKTCAPRNYRTPCIFGIFIVRPPQVFHNDQQ